MSFNATTFQSICQGIVNFLEVRRFWCRLSAFLEDMDLKFPHLGEGADSGTVVNLFVKEGDKLTKDQPVLELENEKAVATIPSTVAGTVAKLFVKPGDKLSVGQKILSVADSGSGARARSRAARTGARTGTASFRRLRPNKCPWLEEEAGRRGRGARPGHAPAAAPSTPQAGAGPGH